MTYTMPQELPSDLGNTSGKTPGPFPALYISENRGPQWLMNLKRREASYRVNGGDGNTRRFINNRKTA